MASMFPIKREVGAAAIWLAAAGALMSGCDDKFAAIDACKLGQQEACERACDLGVGDEGGCMAAGLGWVRRAGLTLPSDGSRFYGGLGRDEEPAGRERAVLAYRSACDAGVADGCVFAVQLHDDKFAYRLFEFEERGPQGDFAKPYRPLMDAAILTQRRALLRRACELRSVEGCWWLGASLLGDEHEAAGAAFTQSCKLDGDNSADCLARERKLVKAAAEAARRCAKPKADDCNALGELILTVDPARAPMLYARAHRIRGVQDRKLAYRIWRQADAALQRLYRGFNTGDGWWRRPAAKPPAVQLERVAPNAKVRFGKATLSDADYAEEALRDGLEKAHAAFKQCYAPGLVRRPALQGRVTVRFLIDVTGDPFDLGGGADLPDGSVVNCVVNAVDDLVLPAPKHGPVSVSQPIMFTPGARE
jgi:hypothetical protein